MMRDKALTRSRIVAMDLAPPTAQHSAGEHRYYGPINCADSVPKDGSTPVLREKCPINIGIK
jgi:hypothetical protein